jgi:hypothetical protein
MLMSGQLAAGKVCEISAVCKPTKIGPLSVLIIIQSEPASEQCPPIEVIATVVQSSLALVLDGREISDVDFGTVFLGQRRIIQMELVNRGMYKSSYVVMSPQDEPIASEHSSLADQFEPLADSGVPAFAALPAEGLINPYGSSPLSFIFTPQEEILGTDDVESLFNQFSTIEVVETGQKIDLQLGGKGVRHLVKLSSMDFDFGKRSVMEKVDQTLTIFNESHFLPITFSIRPHAHFRFVPMEGEIEATKSKDVTITFFPKNFGVFEVKAIITFCGTLLRKHFNLTGSCGEPAEQPFTRLPIWETDRSANYTAHHPSRYALGLQELMREQRMRKTFHNYITAHAKRREALTALATIRTRAQRNAESLLSRTVGQYTPDDLSEAVEKEIEILKQNGLDSAMKDKDGIIPSDPPVPRGFCPIHLLRPEKFGLEQPARRGNEPGEVVHRQKIQQDDTVTIKKKFKSKPTTAQEVTECTRLLTPAQQLLVVASHQTINFGQTSVFSHVVRSFTIQNDLMQNIIVTINYEFDELSASTPVSQVIPPRSIGGFDVAFMSRRPINFMKTISYSINGHHNYHVNVSGNVIPIEMQLSRSLIEFRFSPDSITPQIKEFVTIINKSNAVGEFNWTGCNSSFTMAATSGTVEPLRTVNVEITYLPTNHPHDEVTLIMNVIGGNSKALRCIGDVGVPKCQMMKKQINFGLIPIGIAKTERIRIKNSGDDDAIFTVQQDSQVELSISPMSGRVAAHESQTLELKFSSATAKSFEHVVTVLIAGANPLTFSVTGQSELPQVQMSATDFDFGKLFVGSSASIEASIVNTGAIPAILFLDLSSRPEFRLEYASDLSDKGGDERSNSITLVSSEALVAGPSGGVSPSSSGVVKPNNKQAASGLIYRIYIAEKLQIAFTLVFQPTDVGEHSFEFPITMMNVLSASSFHLQPIVSAEAIRPPLSLSTNTLNFGVAPLHDPLNPNFRATVNPVVITNDWRTALVWHFDVSALDTSVFKVDTSGGTIQPGESRTVHISFTPKGAVPYNFHLPIYSKSDRDDSLIGSIQMIGMGTAQTFSMSADSLALPIVPLNVKSESQIYVINDAFVETTLRVVLPVDESHFPIKISFPEGNALHYTCQKLPILVSFQSSKPASFSTLVGLVDTDGRAASFTVACTADNSVMTLYPMLDAGVKLRTGGGKPITIETKSINKRSELMSRFSSVGDFTELDGADWAVSYNKLQLSFLQRYFNALVLNTQLSDFPDDLIRNEGALLHELTTNLNGGKPLKAESVDRGEKTISDPVMKRRDQLNKLLHALQSAGALVSLVKPEFLMSKSDFLSLMMGKVTRQLLGIDRYNAPEMSSFDQKVLGEFTSSKPFSEALMSRLKVLETVYEDLSNESWMFLLMQICKVLILGRIEPDRLSKTPGVSEAIQQLNSISSRFSTAQELMAEINRSTKSILASNVYSPADGALLKWVSIHHCAVTGDLQNAITSFYSLDDAIAFGSLLKAHTSVFKGPVIENPTEKAHCEQNAIEFASSLKELKLGFSPRAEEIVSGSPPIIALSLCYLYETLPHYLPMMNLQFVTTLHKSMTKSVSISNPSKAEILYKATLEGNQNYALTMDSIIVPPSSSIDFPIQFHARTVKLVSARLTLRPSKPRFLATQTERTDSEGPDTGTARTPNQPPTFFSPIVVDLLSSVTLSNPDGQYAMEGVLYQNSKLMIPVKNLVRIPCKMRLTSKVILLADENGRPVQQTASLGQQITELVLARNEDVPPPENQEKESQFKNYVTQHRTFLFSHRTIEFTREDDEVTLDVEFIPIRLATFRCLLLFNDESSGEFVLELSAKSLLPPPTDIAGGKLKAESGSHCTHVSTLDLVNISFIRAIAYSAERHYALVNMISERKFKDLLARRVRECEILYRQNFVLLKFSVLNSAPQFFEVPNEVLLAKITADTKTPPNQKANSLPITFKPSKAGDYPCRLILLSANDIRVFSLKALGLPATRELSLDFATVAGKAVKQEIPLQNPSAETWTYKVTIAGDSSFTVPPRLSVKPNSTGFLPITLTPAKMGQVTATMTVTNMNKESNVVYNLSANVDEPPAEQTFIVQCQARQKKTFSFPVRSNIIKSGKVLVTTTVPVISCYPEVEFVNGECRPDFSYTVYAQRSGVAAGTIHFTDPLTKNFVWYVLEVSVDPPAPEQTISVATIARKCVTVKIPITNPKSHEAKFTVVLSDDDLFGQEIFAVRAGETLDYCLIVSPLKAMKRSSSVYFYSDEDGEFWYSLKIEASPPPEDTLAPLTSPIGKFVSSFVLVENPLDKPVSFRVENSNATSFSVVAKRMIQLSAKEKKRVEIRYIPSSVGVKETATISFLSNEIGDWVYNITGSGKPPQPLSPIIVSSPVNATNSALVVFNNPFPYPARFSVSLSQLEEMDIFNFLVKRKVFTLSSYDEEFQIPFTFTPPKLGQFQAHIVVASLGPSRGPLPKLDESPGIRWLYPLIGTGIDNATPNVQTLHCKAQTTLEQNLSFTLSGETEIFEATEYALQLSIPTDYDFLHHSMDMRCQGIQRQENAAELAVSAKFSPQRPFQLAVPMSVRNPLGQEWRFELEFKVDRGRPTGTIVVESFLNKTGKAKVVIPTTFNAQTPFHAYFVQGSASEFSVDAEHGFLEPAVGEGTELPASIVFAPKMYGKVLKGMLAVDTLEAQWLFDVIGKTPEYVPPVVKPGPSRLMPGFPVEDQKRAHTAAASKRSFVKENIEGAKIAKPKVNPPAPRHNV